MELLLENGRVEKDMPSWKDVLTDEQIDSLVTLAKGWKKEKIGGSRLSVVHRVNRLWSFIYSINPLIYLQDYLGGDRSKSIFLTYNETLSTKNLNLVV